MAKIFAGFTLIISALAMAPANQNNQEAVVRLTDYNFDAYISRNHQVAVLFLTKNLKECIEVFPKYENIAQHMKNSPAYFPLAIINLDLNPNTAKKHPIIDNEIIKIFRKDHIDSYHASDIMNWLQEQALGTSAQSTPLVQPRRTSTLHRNINSPINNVFQAAKANNQGQNPAWQQGQQRQVNNLSKRASTKPQQNVNFIGNAWRAAKGYDPLRDPRSPESKNNAVNNVWNVAKNDPFNQDIPSNRPQSQNMPSNRPQSQNMPSNRPQSPNMPSNRPQSPNIPSNRPQSQNIPSNRPQSPTMSTNPDILSPNDEQVNADSGTGDDEFDSPNEDDEGAYSNQNKTLHLDANYVTDTQNNIRRRSSTKSLRTRSRSRSRTHKSNGHKRNK